MKIGIIAEFNPLHSGHIHLIQSVKKQYPDAQFFVIMSTYLTQRGEFSFISPYQKTMLALQNDVDFVFELPAVFSVQRADLFAFGAIDICKKLELDAIAFGVENIDFFNEMTELSHLPQKTAEPYLARITSLNQHLSQSPHWKSSANNILAYFYQTAASSHYPALRFIPIQRTGSDYNDKNLKTNIASATAIRHAITSNKQAEIKQFIPYSPSLLTPHITWESLFPFFIQMILTTPDLTKVATIGKSGLDQRMKKASTCTTFDDYMQHVKTKAYTTTSIQRAMLFTLLNITQDELDQFCTYAQTLPPRLLGVKKEMTPLLKSLHYYTSYKQIEQSHYRQMLEKIEALFFTHLKQQETQHFPFIYGKNMS